MGEVYDTFGIWTSDSFYLRSLRMKVDTGATYSQLPDALLREMGWAPTHPPRYFILANGVRVVSNLGIVRMRYKDTNFEEMFVFGEDDCTPLVGVELLQNLRLGVDPVNHRLIPIAPQL